MTTLQFTVMKRGWSHHWSYGRYFLWARPHWILLLGPMCWISHFGPDGHEKRVISLIRIIVCVSYFHGKGRTLSTMGFCGVEVIRSTRAVQTLGPVLLGYWWSKCHSVCENGHSWFLLILACYLIWLPSAKCFLFATMKNLTTKPQK